MLRKVILLILLCFICLLPAAHAEYTVLEPQYPVPDYVSLLLEIAGNEVGYTEDKRGYTKYGEWAGDPYAQWCAEYLCWCVDQVDQQHGTSLLHNIYPLYSGQNSGRDWFIQNGRYVTRDGYLDGWGYQWFHGADDRIRNGDYIPQPGDWVFFTWTNDSDTDHVAMVEFASIDENGDTFVHVLEGNDPDCVQRTAYSIRDDRILGYGTVHDVAGFTMRGGNTSIRVAELQAKLVALGYLDPQYATGTYGPSTTRAVSDFQKAMKLSSSGRATRETQYALNACYNELIGWQVEATDAQHEQTAPAESPAPVS